MNMTNIYNEFKVENTLNAMYSMPKKNLNFYIHTYLSGKNNRFKRQLLMSYIECKKVPLVKCKISDLAESIMNHRMWQLGERLRSIGIEDGQNYMVFEAPVWREMKFLWNHHLYGFSPHFEHSGDFTYRMHFSQNKMTFKDRNNVIHNF